MKNIITVDKLHCRCMILITRKRPKHAAFFAEKKVSANAFNYFVVSLSFRTKLLKNSSVNGTLLAENRCILSTYRAQCKN